MFDPMALMQLMGLSPHQTQTIENYFANGYNGCGGCR